MRYWLHIRVRLWQVKRELLPITQNPHYSGLIAAHKTFPIGSEVRVVNLDNGRSAVVKIVDRGPFIRGRIIDVSTDAAGVLGFRQSGTAHVQIEKINVGADAGLSIL